MLKPIVELERFASFSPQPHAVATDGTRLWISSRATRNIDVIERDGFNSVGELVPPGMPWGMTFAGDQLVMTCGETDQDMRRIRRFVAGDGFAEGYVACPDDTGSHLAMHDGNVLLGQWYNKKLLLLDDSGKTLQTYDAPHGIAGVAVVDGIACILGTDDEDAGDYWISRLELGDSGASAQDVALVPFHARGLAWDGSQWWTNHREADRVVAFVLPN